MKEYSKPEVKKIQLVNEEAVADQCWSLSNPSPVTTEIFWFDLNGRDPGFYHFEYLRNNCGNNTHDLHLFYHTGLTDMSGGADGHGGTEVSDWSPYYEFMDEDVLGPNGAPPSFGNGYPHGPNVIEDSY